MFSSCPQFKARLFGARRRRARAAADVDDDAAQDDEGVVDAEAGRRARPRPRRLVRASEPDGPADVLQTSRLPGFEVESHQFQTFLRSFYFSLGPVLEGQK